MIGQIIEKETVVPEYSIDLDGLYKINKRLGFIYKKYFNFTILVEKDHPNRVVLVCRHMVPEHPILVYTAKNANREASLNECLKQFVTTANKLDNVVYNKRNIKLNEWWSNFFLKLRFSACNEEKKQPEYKKTGVKP